MTKEVLDRYILELDSVISVAQSEESASNFQHTLLNNISELNLIIDCIPKSDSNKLIWQGVTYSYYRAIESLFPCHGRSGIHEDL